MKREYSSPHVITGAFAFLLLGLFAVFSTIIVLLGVKAYRGAVERTEQHNTARIGNAYIRSMLRSDDEIGALSFEEIEGAVSSDSGEETVTLPTLALRNDYDGETYITRIYVYDGSLREWFTREETPFHPDDGEIVCPAEELQANFEGRLLRVRICAGGEWSEVFFSPRAANQRLEA